MSPGRLFWRDVLYTLAAFSRQTLPIIGIPLNAAALGAAVRRKSAFDSLWKLTVILIMLWASFVIGIELGRLLATVSR